MYVICILLFVAQDLNKCQEISTADHNIMPHTFGDKLLEQNGDLCILMYIYVHVHAVFHYKMYLENLSHMFIV
jgi:hypothetical protein